MQAWINHCIQENWPVWDLVTLDTEKSGLCDETLAMEEASIKKKKKNAEQAEKLTNISELRIVSGLL